MLQPNIILNVTTVLCADEPTSGLDSFTAITVVESLKRMCHSSNHNTTVICSIHQPRRNIFDLFDSVLLLSKGGAPVYCGPVAKMIEYFSLLGHECLEHSNPADYFIDIASIDGSSIETKMRDKIRVQRLIQAFDKDFHARTHVVEVVDHSPVASIETKNVSEVSYVSWFSQVVVLTHRFSRNSFRNIGFFFSSLTQVILMSLVLAAIFWDLGNSIDDIQSRKGLLYMAISMENYLLLVVSVERYGNDLRIFDRELQDKMYQTSAYFTAHFLANLPLLLLMPILYILPIYYGCGLRSTSVMFGNFLGVSVVLSFAISALALLSVSCHRAFAVSSLIANTNYTFITLGAGFLLNFQEVPVYVRWVKFVSFLNYAYQIVMTAEFSDRVFPGCLSVQPNQCSQYIGNDILEGQGIGVNAYLGPWCSLIAFPIAYYVAAAMLLEYVRHPPTGAAIVLVADGFVEQDEDVVEDNLDETGAGSISKRSSPNDSVIVADEENLMASLPYQSPTSITVHNLSLYVKVHASLIAGGYAPTSSGGAHFKVTDSENDSALVDNSEVIVDDSPTLDDHDDLPSLTKGDSVKDLLDGSRRVVHAGLCRKCILNDISVTISSGQLVALMGGSGSGI
jgi:ABC-type cobalamin/Fe3+-siderophores transport system ATPase subunit/ABC-type multidrug transport system permease subunit